MRNFNRKLFSIILTLVMAVTMIPAFGITASADGHNPSTCQYTAPITSGNHTLILGGKEAGAFTITGNTCNGYSLKDNNSKYITFENGVLKTDSDKASFKWKYDGGLYVETKTTCKTNLLSKAITKTVKQYLSYDGEKFILSDSKICAEIQVSENEHTWAYSHNGDGLHEAYCTKCGYREGAVQHEYGEDGKCDCGKLNPDLCYVSDVKVTEKKLCSFNIFWFCPKKTTKYYRYTIKPETQNVGVLKVEYSFDKELSETTRWKSCSCLTIGKRLDEFFIRITDTNGKVTNWKYKKGEVLAIYSITCYDENYCKSDESNPTMIIEKGSATLKFTTTNALPGYIINVENAILTSWTQSEDYTTGEMVISNPTGDVVITYSTSCFAKGTKVTMADRSEKNIEDVSLGDEVLTFNHETGNYEAQKVYYVFVNKNPIKTVKLHFNEGSDVSLNMHNLFVQESCKYELITKANAQKYIGKHFYNSSLGKYVELLSVDYNTEPADVYSIYTTYNNTSIANGLLSVPDDIGFAVNFYKFNEDLTADKDALAADIKKYGLYEYDDNSVYTRQEYDMYNIKYVNIIVGKGLITWDELIAMREEFFAGR